MESKSASTEGAFVKEMPLDDKQVIQWILGKPISDQKQAAKDHCQRLLKSASQPRHASGNACVKLCYFLEQCRKSNSLVLQEVAFSHRICLDLFTFYVEWNEKNQHRSMRQVLELLATLVAVNPDKSIANAIKVEILQQLLSIISHQSAQPFVKPTFKVLECFLSRSTISVTELMHKYCDNGFLPRPTTFQGHSEYLGETAARDLFVSAVFDWMCLPDTSPAAGKLLVTLFKVLRKALPANALHGLETHTMLWERWIRHGLARHPDSLENIKNYLFTPLFKIDRIGSLDFLQGLAQRTSIEALESKEVDAQAFLLLSAMEVGKKSGLVDEPNISMSQKRPLQARNCIMLPVAIIGGLLSHSSSSVRSLALSVLVSSISSIRPFPSKTIDLLKSNLGILHADTDAKFRNELMSNTKHMIERLRGAISYLVREPAVLLSSSRKSNETHEPRSQLSKARSTVMAITSAEESLGSTGFSIQEIASLEEHKQFIRWYLHFLLNELIPTASYQRHITALKAIHITIKSGILAPQSKESLHSSQISQPIWTIEVVVFTETMMRLLLDLIMDPFEDVRAAATDLLKLALLRSSSDQDVPKSIKHPSSALPASPTEGLQALGNDISLRQETSGPSDSEEVWKMTTPRNLLQFIKRTEEVSRRTGRADFADGVARSSELLWSLLKTDESRLDLIESLVEGLESKLVVAEDDLAQAVLIAPIHGQFASLRLVWDQIDQLLGSVIQSQNQTLESSQLPRDSLNRNSNWIELQYRISRCCERIWVTVKDVLCNDSPEGHLPCDLNELDTVDTKDVLSYSFRAVHESSNLLRVMVSKLKLKFPDGTPFLPFEVFQIVGNLSFEQLSNLRHRGAFSTVSSTFARCCQFTQEGPINGPSTMFLLEKWYQGALICIQAQASTTRRSAGIPALVTGILSANSSSPAFEDVMVELKTLAQQPALSSEKDETNLPQVHAMNCLKEIFKSSTIGKRCENHLADCLQLAADSLKSKTWAIRNCGLLLLRSLIDCLFGTNESRVTTEAGWDGRSTRISYERYSALPELLLKLMTTEMHEQGAFESPEIGAIESVFPALDILRRAGPPKMFRKEIYACTTVHLGSKVWHVRDLAARTMCTLLLGSKWLPKVLNLLEKVKDSVNRLHGVLMAIKYLLERRLELSPQTASEGLLTLWSTLEARARQGQWKLCTTIGGAYEEVAVVMFRILHLMPRTTSTIPEESKISDLKKMLLTEDVFDRINSLLRSDFPTEGQSSEIENSVYPKARPVVLLKAMTLRALYSAEIEGQINRLDRLVTCVAQHDVDTACAVLEHMPFIWEVPKTRAEDLTTLANVYFKAFSVSSSNHLRAIALRNLADVLEHLSELRALQQIVMNNSLHRVCFWSLSIGSPDLSNAEIRVTGSILVHEFLSRKENDHLESISERIQTWGYMLSAAIDADKDFETRHAAVAALGAFYRVCYADVLVFTERSFFVPSLLALYDTLNDDDDEIREMGAKVVSRMFGTCLAPLKACGKFLQWLHQNFGGTEAFCITVLQRITENHGPTGDELELVGKQLAKAMLHDDSLFIEEEQNLYIDEVRETIAWTSLLTAAEGLLWDETASRLSAWALEGLHALTRLAESEDGPFGWSSKPRVFAICMRIVLATKTLLARYKKGFLARGRIPSSADSERRVTKHNKPDAGENEELLQIAIQGLLEIGRVNKFHPIFVEILGKHDFCSI